MMDRYFIRDLMIFITYAMSFWWGVYCERLVHEERMILTSNDYGDYLLPEGWREINPETFYMNEDTLEVTHDRPMFQGGEL